MCAPQCIMCVLGPPSCARGMRVGCSPSSCKARMVRISTSAGAVPPAPPAAASAMLPPARAVAAAADPAMLLPQRAELVMGVALLEPPLQLLLDRAAAAAAEASAMLLMPVAALSMSTPVEVEVESSEEAALPEPYMACTDTAASKVRMSKHQHKQYSAGKKTGQGKNNLLPSTGAARTKLQHPARP